jgi:hypothetical protein
MTITEFLEARISEDEKLAEEASISMHGQRHTDAWDYTSYVLSSERDATEAQDKFIVNWWPARVLAECAAKRAIIEAFDPDAPDLDPYVGRDVIAMLAAVYKDHPDYQQEWALDG